MTDIQVVSVVMFLVIVGLGALVVLLMVSFIAKHRDMWISYHQKIKDGLWWMHCHSCGHKFLRDEKRTGCSYYSYKTGTHRPECPQCGLRADGSKNEYKDMSKGIKAHNGPGLDALRETASKPPQGPSWLHNRN